MFKRILSNIDVEEEDYSEFNSLFYDKGIVGDTNQNWSDTRTLPVIKSVGTEYTSLTKSNSNKPGVIRPMINIRNGITIEFDVCLDGSGDIFATIRHGTNVRANLKFSSLNLNPNTWNHIIISIDNNRMVMKSNTNENIRTWKLKSFNRFYFGVGLDTNELRYKNFKIYD